MALAIGVLTLEDGTLTLGEGAGADGRCAAARTAAGDATGLEPWSVPLGLRGDGAFPLIDGALRPLEPWSVPLGLRGDGAFPLIDGALRPAGRFDALRADAAGAVRAAGADGAVRAAGADVAGAFRGDATARR